VEDGDDTNAGVPVAVTGQGIQLRELYEQKHMDAIIADMKQVEMEFYKANADAIEVTTHCSHVISLLCPAVVCRVAGGR
jgi:hypothetical protein